METILEPSFIFCLRLNEGCLEDVSNFSELNNDLGEVVSRKCIQAEEVILLVGEVMCSGRVVGVREMVVVVSGSSREGVHAL